MNFQLSEQYFKEGQEHLVGAVNSPVRAFKSVGGNPLFIEKAKGSYIKDVDGNQYIDLVLSYGPMILGHRYKEVEKAVKKALKKGTTFGASSKKEIQLASLVCSAFPNMDKVRFVSSGTEAVLSAIRLARAYTGNDKIIKFSGCYHGHSDALLVAAGSGLATLSLPGSKGVPSQAVENTLIANYNDLESVSKHIEKHSDIAAIILEPIGGNMGVVIPDEKFVKGLNDLAKKHQILIIADEVMTGFRSCFGGASSLIGLEADITCLGKVIGGGFPVGAYGARNEIMEMVAPLGPMYQAGTLSGNPIAMASGLATLKNLKAQNPYSKFEAIAQKLASAFQYIADQNNVPLTVNRFGSMINPFFTDRKVKNFEDAQTCCVDSFAVFFWEMIKNNVFIPPSQFEAWFLASSLTDEDVDNVIQAFEVSIKKIAQQKQ